MRNGVLLCRFAKPGHEGGQAARWKGDKRFLKAFAMALDVGACAMADAINGEKHQIGPGEHRFQFALAFVETPVMMEKLSIMPLNQGPEMGRLTRASANKGDTSAA